jgi:hypothetical protein
MSASAGDNIWELAIGQQRQKIKTGQLSKASGSERNLLLVGSKGKGLFMSAFGWFPLEVLN